MEGEIWKDIPRWEGFYQASSLGRIKSVHRYIKNSKGSGVRSVRERILRIIFNKRIGYSYVSLQRDGVALSRCVHRLVANTFLPNPNNLPEVNHIDCNKTNNSVENLEWVSIIENRRHASVNGLTPRGESHGISKLTEKEAMEIKHGHKNLLQTQIAEMYGIHKHTVSSIRRGKRWIYLK